MSDKDSHDFCAPLHMTHHDRMERLYNFLVAMGNVVHPIYHNNEIDCLYVSVSHLPLEILNQKLESSPVPSPTSGTQEEAVKNLNNSPKSYGENVISFHKK